jgi:hypothetical protein
MARISVPVFSRTRTSRLARHAIGIATGFWFRSALVTIREPVLNRPCSTGVETHHEWGFVLCNFTEFVCRIGDQIVLMLLALD